MPSTITNRQSQSGKASTVLIVLGVLFLVFVIGGVGCYFLMQKGFGMMEDQVKNALKENPVVLEHLGEIKTISLDLMASGEAGDSKTFVFDVTGSKGNGRLTANLVQEGENHKVTAGSLKMKDDDTVYPLFPGATPPADVPPAGTAPDDTPPK